MREKGVGAGLVWLEVFQEEREEFLGGRRRRKEGRPPNLARRDARRRVHFATLASALPLFIHCLVSFRPNAQTLQSFPFPLTLAACRTRKSFRNSFPDAVLGTASMNSTTLRCLYEILSLATWCLMLAMISSAAEGFLAICSLASAVRATYAARRHQLRSLTIQRRAQLTFRPLTSAFVGDSNHAAVLHCGVLEDVAL